MPRLMSLPVACGLAIVLAFPAASVARSATSAAQVQDVRQRDRASILAMAGDYLVRFDMRETVSFVEGYKPIDEKLSGGYESVRVIEDGPRGISLQHMLVVGSGDETMVVKHWRQDWVYEPATVLAYKGAGHWALEPVPRAERTGAWSQTVWQTDDSPRYGGVGRWEYSNGVARWTSAPTARPLARRDAIRNPVYDRYMGANRHALTPTGWVHEQDNAKIGMKDGKPVTFVHEVVLNTYSRSDKFPAKAADDYWAATKVYWTEVRAAWDAAIARGTGVVVAEEPQNGSVTGPRLMELADEIVEGKTTSAKAVAEARAIISNSASARLAAAP